MKNAILCVDSPPGFQFSIRVIYIASQLKTCKTSPFSPVLHCNMDKIGPYVLLKHISGDGHVLPPMVIVSGVLHQEQCSTKRFTIKRQLGKWRLLLLDCYGSHYTKEFLDFCDDQHIIPYCLPPYMTYLLQPLDVVCFQPYKHFHAEAVDAATRTGCSDFNKLEFLTALGSVREHLSGLPFSQPFARLG